MFQARVFPRGSRDAVCILLTGIGLAVSSVVCAAESRPPNVVFILADDLGWGDLSCYGNAFIKTPGIDRLAKEGTLFTNFYVCGSVCSPSRCAFFTGQYPSRHRIHGHYAARDLNEARGMSNWLEPSVPNMARLLKSAGYATAHVGKWHLGNDANGPATKDYGFDFVGTGERGGARVTGGDPNFRANSSRMFVDESLEFIRANKDQPFYLQLWTLVPHATLNPTAEQLAPFQRLNPQNVPHQSARAIFYASVTDLDQQIGRLLKGLDDLGLTENTLVVFSSDNGPEEIFIGNAGHSGVGSPGPFRGRKRSLYEGGVRVPYLVRLPGTVPAGAVDNKSVVAGVDFLPTVCKLAGVSIPPKHLLDGEDVSDIFSGSSRDRRGPLFWQWRFRIAGHVNNISPQLAVRDGKWKLLLNPDRSRVELYDLTIDPMQVDNVAGQNNEIVERLAQQVVAWSRTLPEGPYDPGAGDNKYAWPVPTAK